MSAELLIDCDSHCYEPPDTFVEYIDPSLRQRAFRTFADDEGVQRVEVDGRRVVFLEGHQPPGKVGRPGSLKAFMASLKSGDRTAVYEWLDPEPAHREPDARLELMDEQGIEATLLFPSEAVVAEHFLTDDLDLLYAHVRALNRYLHEQWGMARAGRIFAVPWLSLADVDRAVNELDTVLSQGARVIGLRPGPAFGRSPADPHFDPFWQRCNEAGVAVAFHLSESGYNRSISALWGEEPDPPHVQMSAWQWANCWGDRPIMDTISALVLGNLFGRFPRLRALSVENGAEWAPYMVRQMDKSRSLGRNGPWIGGPLRERPSQIFAEHVIVTTYPEDDLDRLVGDLGVSSLALGSDWPHPEGLAHPGEYRDTVAHLPDTDQRTILRTNGARALGLAD